MSANSKQVGGDHYKGKLVEHWDFVLMHNIPYLEAVAMKYIMRHTQKGGREDLQKAIHYIEKLIETSYPTPECLHETTSVRMISYFDGRDNKYETQCLICTKVYPSSLDEIDDARAQGVARQGAVGPAKTAPTSPQDAHAQGGLGASMGAKQAALHRFETLVRELAKDFPRVYDMVDLEKVRAELNSRSPR